MLKRVEIMDMSEINLIDLMCQVLEEVRCASFVIGFLIILYYRNS